jgi:hypothetical protein
MVPASRVEFLLAMRMVQLICSLSIPPSTQKLSRVEGNYQTGVHGHGAPALATPPQSSCQSLPSAAHIRRSTIVTVKTHFNPPLPSEWLRKDGYLVLQRDLPDGSGNVERIWDYLSGGRRRRRVWFETRTRSGGGDTRLGEEPVEVD